MLLQSIVIILLLEGAVVLMLNSKVLEFDKRIGIAVFGGLPILLLTLVQIYTTSVVQRANLVKDLASKLYTDKELTQTFHFLVYTFDDKLYDAFLKANSTQRAEMNVNRPEGLRLFDPSTLTGSDEERRLDALLGYMDIIAYHYHRRLVQMVDIAGVLGYQLAIISSRKAVTEYLNSIPSFWKESRYGRTFGKESVPLRYLDKLLVDYRVYCQRQNPVD